MKDEVVYSLHFREDKVEQKDGKQVGLENVGRDIIAVEQIQSSYLFVE